MTKPQLSVITTSPGAPASKTGMPDGAHGWAMRVGMDALPLHATPELARRMMSCSRAFSAQHCATRNEQAEVLEAVAYLERKAPRTWIAARVSVLLSHYFVSPQDDRLATALAEDWCATLAAYPAWAIADACQWWLSRHNPRKQSKPLPGDIEERAHAALAPLRAATLMAKGALRSALSATPEPTPAPTDAPSRLSPAEVERRRRVAAEIMAGFVAGHTVDPPAPSPVTSPDWAG